MKLTIKNAAFALALCGLASCANEAPWGNGSRGKGGINLKLEANADVKDALPSVRAGVPELVAPDVADFAIEMKNLDTDQVQTWRTLEEFNSHSKDEGFDVGSYTLTAFYGNINECGFYKPYFEGKTDINILEGRETSVNITAQLANVMLSVDYTDAFREYFRDYSVTAHTEGHANVVFGRSESRAGFLTPGDLTLQIALTNPSGKSVTLTPAQFPAVARHHYHVKFDVNAEPLGDATLTVVFDDSTTIENVTFQLTDELYTAEVPVVHGEGFTSGTTVEALSGNPAQSPLKFETICMGGIKSAILKIAQVGGATPWNPSFDKELDLIQADESVQYELEKNGIKVAGLFKNPEHMAVVDVTELPKYLPEGTFEITFTVTDNLGRNEETPVKLNLSTLPINLMFEKGSAKYVYYGGTDVTVPEIDATVTVTYNGMVPEECISFKSLNYSGILKDCDIVTVQESAATRGFPDKTYTFNIKVCDVETSPLPMEMWLNGEKYEEFNINVREPQYTVVEDAFATFARFKVEAEDPAETGNVINGLKLYKDGSALADVERDAETGILTIPGLTPDKEYTIGFSLTSRPNGIPESQTLSVQTEKVIELDNGGFSDIRRTIDQDMQVGGVYKCGAFDYTNWSHVKVDEPNNWASINEKTFYKNANPVNSWFTVVSTYIDKEPSESNNYVVKIRSVGYDHKGTLPGKTGEFFSTTHYNNGTPTISSKAAGELFLGEYSFDGTDHRVDGIEFKSRPMSLSFECSYIPCGSDIGLAKVEILDSNGNIIASGSRNIAFSSMHKENVPIEGYPFGSKAAKIRVQFKSSNEDFSLEIPNPNVDSWSGTLPATPYRHNLGDNNYHSYASGSVLTIDNVKLNY